MSLSDAQVTAIRIVYAVLDEDPADFVITDIAVVATLAQMVIGTARANAIMTAALGDHKQEAIAGVVLTEDEIRGYVRELLDDTMVQIMLGEVGDGEGTG
jgi:glycerate-2-kinase